MNETCKYKVTESELPGIQGVLSLFFFCSHTHTHTHTQISVCFSPPLPCEKLVKNNDTNRHKMKPDDTKIKNLVPKPFLEEQIKVEAFFCICYFLFNLCK
jgi:hypothetical protein